VLRELFKLAEKLEKEKKYNKVDSITKYLVELSKSKMLKSSPELKNDVPTKLSLDEQRTR